jgi:hypothetical protein
MQNNYISIKINYHSPKVIGMSLGTSRTGSSFNVFFSFTDSIINTGDVQGLNQYQYVDGSPMQHTDPSGNITLAG